MTSLNLRRLAAAVATFSLSFTASAAINSAAIVSSTLSPQCLEYKVVGICYWLLCGPHGCKVKTSVKVRHYVPDAVVSSYANTGSNPWAEVSALGTPNPLAQAGNDATTNYKAENSIGRFKEADVIGHPGGATFSRFASASGPASCSRRSPISRPNWNSVASWPAIPPCGSSSAGNNAPQGPVACSSRRPMPIA
ncbi:TraU family protein, partial [Pseudomonas aeruginosa]|uniref:TraU family protein n=2 Tax=Gammaproteobacteria TaxID=1236 RepID=UPI001F210C37